MRICVYGAASATIDKKYTDASFELGEYLAGRGHTLVYGAGSSGVMGAVSRGFKKGGGHVIGVIPKFFEENGYEAINYECDKLIYTETMAERKAIMEDTCEAFIIAPGGIGTFEEFFQVFTLKQLGRHAKAIVVFNSHGYYDQMKKLLEKAMEDNFINDDCAVLVAYVNTKEEVAEYLESYSPDGINWANLKKSVQR